MGEEQAEHQKRDVAGVFDMFGVRDGVRKMFGMRGSVRNRLNTKNAMLRRIFGVRRERRGVQWKGAEGDVHVDGVCVLGSRRWSGGTLMYIVSIKKKKEKIRAYLVYLALFLCSPRRVPLCQCVFDVGVVWQGVMMKGVTMVGHDECYSGSDDGGLVTQQQ